MPETKKRHKQTVADAVRQDIKDQHPGGATFQVMAQSIRKQHS